LETIHEFLHKITDPHSIIEYGGLILLLIVVFAETGLFIGFFLPGDSLLFIAGMICHTHPELIGVGIVPMMAFLVAAAVLGNIAGYWFGHHAGNALFKRDDSLIFKKRYVKMTSDYYNRHGGKTLVLGRFLPVIRTFAPILAGVIKIPLAQFMFYNLSGALLWVVTLCLLGYFLGSYPWVEDNIGYITLFLILVTLIPLVRTYFRTRRQDAGIG
jgi:membrane-associated protein